MTLFNNPRNVTIINKLEIKESGGKLKDSEILNPRSNIFVYIQSLEKRERFLRTLSHLREVHCVRKNRRHVGQ